MSERQSSHGVSASAAHDEGSPKTQPSLTPATSARGLQRTVSTGQLGSFAEPQRPSLGPSRGLELPPISRATQISPGSFSPSATRIAGVSSILNPDDGAQTGQRRKASQLESPIPSTQQLPPLAPALGRNAPSTMGQQGASPRSPRRILTPRSPSGLHRAASLGQLNPQAGVINAQQVPFPGSPRSSRPYTVEPGAGGAPPLPTPLARAHPIGYGFPAPAPQRDATRRASSGTGRARNLSSSASPSTSYSSYSQAGQTSPVAQYASTTGGVLPPSYGSNSEASRIDLRTASDPILSDAQRQMGIPISSSGGQNVYQMMTLETTSGTVQLPVDVQAASRVADEKRRRNAGASARFRQRRKEKEKEASTSIARLEQQVRELTEDAEFYRNERANLLSIMHGVPGMEHHLQRPTSPRQMRGSVGSIASSMSRRTSYMRPPESEPQSPDSGRNVRRRTSTFSLPAAQSSQLPPPPGPPLQPNYPTTGYSTPIAPHPSGGPLPSLSAAIQRPPGQQQQQPQQPQTPLGPPPLMQAHPQTGPYNPYDRRYSESAPRDGR